MAEEESIEIGVLNKRWGLNGFEVAVPGHPVYQIGNRYYIELKHLTIPDFIERVHFYKDTLAPAINFHNKKD